MLEGEIRTQTQPESRDQAWGALCVLGWKVTLELLPHSTLLLRWVGIVKGQPGGLKFE